MFCNITRASHVSGADRLAPNITCDLHPQKRTA